MNCRRQVLSNRGGFTLIEVILALGIFAIVLVSINTVFFAALRLRQSATSALEGSLPINQALVTMRRDLQNAIPPGGLLAGDFRSGGAGGSAPAANGKAASATAQNGGLDFFTTTGTLTDDQPWGDIQEVNYTLADPTNRATATGKDLVRSVTRNLLATATQAPDVQHLASNIDSLDFLYYDGSQWRDTWDTTAGDNGLPLAVRVRVRLAPTDGSPALNLPPMEMVVLLETQSNTNQVTSTNVTASVTP